jgi:O-antigen ligase
MIIMVMGSRYKPRAWYSFAVFFVVLIVFLVGVTILLGPEQAELIVDRFTMLSTLSTEGGNSNAARIDLVGRTFGIIAEHPLGVGVANVRYYLVDFFLGGVNHAENVYLQLCAEQGLFGVAIFLLLMGWLIVRLTHFVREMNLRPDDDWVGWALLGIAINWLFYGFFNSMVDSMWYWVVMSLGVSLSNITEYEMLRQWRKRAYVMLSSPDLVK